MILTTAVPGSSPAQSLIFSSVNGVSLPTSHFHPTEMTEILLKLTYNRIPGAVQREEKTCNQDRGPSTTACILFQLLRSQSGSRAKHGRSPIKLENSA